jgi:hypothetical protein
MFKASKIMKPDAGWVESWFLDVTQQIRYRRSQERKEIEKCGGF